MPPIQNGTPLQGRRAMLAEDQAEVAVRRGRQT
jgi:hypothetical protein